MSAVGRAGRTGRAGYQTRAERTQQLHGRGRWPSRLVAYLQGGLDALTGTAARHASLQKTILGTAAGRLRAAAPPRPGWLRGLQARVSAAARSVAAGYTHNRLLLGQRPWAFERGGRWSLYTDTFSRAFRELSARGTSRSTQAAVAHMRRLAAAGLATQQPRGLAIALPQTRSVHAAPGVGTRALASSRAPSRSSTAPLAAAPAEKWPTVAIPLAPPVAGANHLRAGARVTPAGAKQQLAEILQARAMHELLLSRLIELLSDAKWAAEFRQAGTHAERLEIALPPSSGVATAQELEALLLEWGFDVSQLAAVISGPFAAPQPLASPGRNAVASAKDLGFSSELGDLDSQLFSLIVDEIVDPEAAYREQVQEFLADLERMPRLSAARRPRLTPPVARASAAPRGYHMWL
ncbi:hypothetical protein IWQ57_000138 [Coemansia nantahalensis]|uniref:Uncharacterized protein n=1 Tax=Coemansia nantahalensis TaxID=2789366 RepID=A0ACC1K8R5_9FUNG|nr:hypothetical protein IWQ57_000138 [Coemansia nantahalensis]